jgi:hypothetical protein
MTTPSALRKQQLTHTLTTSALREQRKHCCSAPVSTGFATTVDVRDCGELLRLRESLTTAATAEDTMTLIVAVRRSSSALTHTHNTHTAHE